MNPTAIAVAVEVPPVIMAPDVSLPVKNAAKETAEGILYGSVSFCVPLGDSTSAPAP